MRRFEYPRLGERVFRKKLDNGLEVVVVSKPSHAKRYAFFATRYGGMDLRFRLVAGPPRRHRPLSGAQDVRHPGGQRAPGAGQERGP